MEELKQLILTREEKLIRKRQFEVKGMLGFPTASATAIAYRLVIAQIDSELRAIKNYKEVMDNATNIS